MLLRLLLTLALIGVLTWLWRHRHRQVSPAKSTKTVEPNGEPMLRCAHCGLYVPQHLALTSGTTSYCSQAHLQLGPRHSEN
ncbi:MAG: PP0621 family protein [Pseudomonas sp.]|uniref:PP0621 family protein n=1 Tax=Pseudomonas sp. TaxID=306 RepID=UPI003BB5F5F3